jgi:hypothetical protein
MPEISDSLEQLSKKAIKTVREKRVYRGYFGGD